MRHYGDITKISGYEVPIVDIVCGGSPCQDLSVAGKREGLSGERSCLFMEQIRIIKEMREKDAAEQLSMSKPNEYIRPRYMVWENVPGAFSSNKGEDFRIVLEDTAKVVERDACIPGPPNKGKWTPSGCIMGNGWSIAWRVHDAQFWGVPQRRKRISLVADFGGQTAPEILFERKGLSGDIAQSGKEGERVAEDTERCAREASHTLKVRGGAEFDRYGKRAGKGALVQTELSGTLGVSQDQTLIAFEPGAASRVGGHAYEDVAGTVVYGISAYDSNAMKSNNPNSGVYVADSTRTLDNNGGNPACNQGGMMVVQSNWDGSQVAPTLTSNNAGGNQRMPDKDNFNAVIQQSVVRRLTPLECERLQGYPDGWTDIGEWYDSKGKKHKDADSPRYKALGNSIALPFWEWMAQRMVKQLKIAGTDSPTMASLFDGIGGFPLVYSRCGCVPVWASEIEEFPIAVTRIRFPDND